MRNNRGEAFVSRRDLLMSQATGVYTVVMPEQSPTQPRGRWWRWWWRGVLVYMLWIGWFGYAVMRGYGHPFGMEWSEVHLYLVAALIAGPFIHPVSFVGMIVFVLWFCGAVIAEGFRQQRWEAHRCVQCTYQLLRGQSRCPECGRPRCHPAPVFRWRWRYVALPILCWVIGVVSAEVWVSVDEQVFRNAVQASGGNQQMSRQRWWPNGDSSIIYTPGKGYWATD